MQQLSLFDQSPFGDSQGSPAITEVEKVRGPGGSTAVTQWPAEAIVVPSLPDYRISEDDPIGEGGQVAKLRRNLAVIKLLKDLQAEGRQADRDEQKELVLYTGWGHSSQPFHPLPKGKWIDFQEEMRPYFTQEEWTAASFSTINAHYTRPDVIRFQWQVLNRLGFSGGRVLEPALGVGHYFGLMPEGIKAKSRLYGCELDLLSGAIARQLYPSVEIEIAAFESVPYEPDYFDLGISNVPFANLAVHDPVLYRNGCDHLQGTGLHNYYFLKMLSLIRPGGLISFITSRFTMDSLDSQVRAYIASQAWFLGSVRLPVSTFEKNAHTKVTTDMIFLMKKGDRENEIPAYSFVQTIDGGGYRLNEFYGFGPFAMIGEMKLAGGRYEDAYECVVAKDIDLSDALAARLNIFSEGLYKPAPLRQRQQLVIESRDFNNPPRDPWIRPGSYAMDDYYRIWQKVNRGWKRAEVEGRQLQRVRGLISIRDAFHRTIAANLNYVSDEALKAVQTDLATTYRRFVSKWGFLHEPANIAAFGDDVDSDNILALERWDPFIGKAERAAIFTQRLLTAETAPDRADTAQDAMIIALRESGKVDFERMIELTGQTEAKLIDELGQEIYLDPATTTWVTADEYLSGNIRQKLALAQRMSDLEREEKWIAESTSWDRNVLALKEVMPREVGPGEIYVQLGSPWVPSEIIQEFIQARLFDDAHAFNGRIGVVYLKTLGHYRLDLSNAYRMRQSAENLQTWGTNRIGGLELVEKCLNGQLATIYDVYEDREGRERKKVNQEATLVARAKQTEIRTAFDKWIWDKPGRVDRLVRIYNERFNSSLPRRYDGTPLHFPGMNPEITLRQLQRDVIARGLQAKALMMAHSVGFGKTFSQIGLAMKLKQMGLRQRILIVVKRTTFSQFVLAFRDAYPMARLAPISSGQTPGQRRRQLARIATEDYDAIITTHPVCAKIPLKSETKISFLAKQVREIEQALLEAEGDRISTKELQKAIKRIQTKINKEMEKGAPRDENALYFEDLGIDAILVDESGAYKNLWFHSIMTRISGVGGSESGRAFDMFLKIRFLQAQGGFVSFATGTPVENSISEVFTMMNFLMPDRLRELGLHHFDAFAATFGKVVTAVEMKPDGSGFRMASRFASFNNVVQLKRLWWEVADSQMDGDKAGIVRPEKITGKAIGVQSEAYPALEQIILTLANRANNLGDVDPSIDNILKIISEADKASLDARLLGKFPEFNQNGERTGTFIEVKEDYAGSKANRCADQVAEIYHATGAAELPNKPGWHRLTQLIFLDSSTPKVGQWTAYADLRQKLIDRGLKPAEIAFAQDYADDDKKARLAAALNSGQIRVAIGHTENMGIGLNCQRLLVALHHLDCPWKPAWLEQREGRIWRQGNLCPKISIYRYVMAGSFDVYRWQTVERKYSFIVIFNSDDLTQNTIEDPGLAVLSAREMTALATGNDDIIRQVELQTKLRILTAQKREYEDTMYSTRGRHRRLTSELANWQGNLERRLAITKLVKEQGIEPANELGAQLYDLCQPHFDVYGQKTLIGELYGSQVFYEGTEQKGIREVRRQSVDRNYWGGQAEGEEAAAAPAEPPPPPKKEVKRVVHLENEELKFYSSFTLRIVEETRAELNAAFLIELFTEDIPAKLREAERQVKGIQQDINETERILQRPFSGSGEIEQVEAELRGVEAQIRVALGDAEAEERQAARVELEIGQEINVIELPEPEEEPV